MESYDLDTDEFLGEWKNEDYVDKTNDMTYRLESKVISVLNEVYDKLINETGV